MNVYRKISIEFPFPRNKFSNIPIGLIYILAAFKLEIGDYG
jgi:hypothetical protein